MDLKFHKRDILEPVEDLETLPHGVVSLARNFVPLIHSLDGHITGKVEVFDLEVGLKPQPCIEIKLERKDEHFNDHDFMGMAYPMTEGMAGAMQSISIFMPLVTFEYAFDYVKLVVQKVSAPRTDAEYIEDNKKRKDENSDEYNPFA